MIVAVPAKTVPGGISLTGRRAQTNGVKASLVDPPSCTPSLRSASATPGVSSNGSGDRRDRLTSQLLAALLVTATFAALAYALGMISRSGALGGLLVGTTIYTSLGPRGFAVLALFVIGGSLLPGSATGQARTGTARNRRRRSARNALANCAVDLMRNLADGSEPLTPLRRPRGAPSQKRQSPR